MRSGLAVSSLILASFGLAPSLCAQIVPDATLSTPSSVPEGCTACVIEGGTVRGSNLFHSFREFSVPSGGQARFNNPTSIQNIFSRVTGQTPSTIDGIVGANGSANLFLINSNGIRFGSNARLELGGSFLASTASRIQFQDGSEWSTNPAQQPILTTSVPIGLGFLNPGTIKVEGAGHRQLTDAGTTDVFAGSVAGLNLIGQGQDPAGLRVAPNQTLAIVGGDVEVEGGVLTAPSGQIEVGSVRRGTVAISSNAAGFRLNYAPDADLGSIRFTRQSALDATGDRFSNIRVYGQSIFSTDASLFVIGNTGSSRVGNIEIEASDAIDFVGLTPFNNQERLPFTQKILRSVTSTTTTGSGADILIKARTLTLSESSFISSLTFGSGKGGDIQIQADRATIGGTSPSESIATTSIVGASAYNSGRSGAVRFSGNRLEIVDGGKLTTLSYQTGDAGDIILNTNEAVVTGGIAKIITVPSLSSSGLNFTSILSFDPSSISSSSVGSSRTGNILIQADRLTTANGATLGTNALGFGKAGNVVINGNQSIRVEGTVQLNLADFAERFQRTQALYLALFGIKIENFQTEGSAITTLGSGGGPGNVFVQSIAGAPTTTQSESGNVVLNTPQLTVRDARITVQNLGTGNAGSLDITANRIQLKNNGLLSASTVNGEGGNVQLRSRLLILDGGTITASAVGGAGSGGNIRVTADAIAALGKSQINATSINEFGGRIQLNTSGFFASPETVISASSSRGTEFNGIVQIQSLATIIEPSSATPASLTVPQIISSCPGQSAGTENRLTRSGTGGLPASPDQDLKANSGWRDPAVPTTERGAGTVSQNQSIKEAQAWVASANGTVQFVADSPNAQIASKSQSHCLRQNQ